MATPTWYGSIGIMRMPRLTLLERVLRCVRRSLTRTLKPLVARRSEHHEHRTLSTGYGSKVAGR